MGTKQRRHTRIKMVLPIRVSATDASNKPFTELAHTLDITPQGARLGAIHHVLQPGDKITIQYRQRKIPVRVVWVRAMEGSKECQVGVEAFEGGETWGLELTGSEVGDVPRTKTTTA
ncbi:MAG TPA: PilZ domain-containing protein [Terriglobales bacterium]|jgi:hypothetical protein